MVTITNRTDSVLQIRTYHLLATVAKKYIDNRSFSLTIRYSFYKFGIGFFVILDALVKSEAPGPLGWGFPARKLAVLRERSSTSRRRQDSSSTFPLPRILVLSLSRTLALSQSPYPVRMQYCYGSKTLTKLFFNFFKEADDEKENAFHDGDAIAGLRLGIGCFIGAGIF
jgi:hypothetical protein